MLSKLKVNNKGLKSQSGFTIIEVLIVLAIAGLIMLIVFLAVPALQRNQRNNARNNEAARISSAVTECLANRNGQAASCTVSGTTDEETAYKNLGITEPSGDNMDGFQQFTSLTFDALGDGAEPTTVDDGGLEEANIAFGVKCAGDGASATTDDATGRDFTVTWRNEPDVARCIGSESN